MKSLYQECLSLGVGADSENTVYIFAESVLYLIGATGAFEFQNHIRKLCTVKSPKRFRLTLVENRYSNLNIKLYTLRLLFDKSNTYAAKKLSAEYEVTARDARLIYLLLKDNEWFKKAVVRRLRELKCKASDLSYSTAHAKFNVVFPDVFKYIKYLTYNKLRFLVKSTNSDFSDYHSELTAKLVQSFYSMVPIMFPDEHLKNYLKRIAHNHAINMIKSGTTQKRGRLVSSDLDSGKRQFSMLCLSQNQLPVSEVGDLADVDGVDNSSEKFELQFSISEVLDKCKSYSRKYRFLLLLLGSEDAEFSNFLKSKGVCKDSEDNIDVQHRVCPETYTNLISDFLKVPKAKVGTLFESLRAQLAW